MGEWDGKIGEIRYRFIGQNGRIEICIKDLFKSEGFKKQINALKKLKEQQ